MRATPARKIPSELPEFKKSGEEPISHTDLREPATAARSGFVQGYKGELAVSAISSSSVAGSPRQSLRKLLYLFWKPLDYDDMRETRKPCPTLQFQ